ncbi:MAG: nucleoside triphosphate pyrophosphohydrolase family protein [Clostridia bacterium]|nr:nucleoside triphosphate pyrophosphohydrolase family protein [Clostridia bacterium]
MTFEQYQSAAQRTSPHGHDKLMNGILGLIGETGEIIDLIKKQRYQGMPEEKAQQRIVEELGDVMWYVAEACAGIGKSIADLDASAQGRELSRHRLEACAVNLILAACNAFDAVRRLEVQDFAPLIAFPRLCDIWLWVLTVCDRIGADVIAVMQDNINKLKRRYPDGFSAERSNERYE